MRATFALFAVFKNWIFAEGKVTTLFVGACWTIHISKSFWIDFFVSSKLWNPWPCLFFKGNIAHLTHGFALRKLIVASAELSKSRFVHAKYIRTYCNRTIHVPNKFYNAIVIPRIRGDCTTHRSCSQLFHTCLQRNIIDYCRGGGFRGG